MEKNYNRKHFTPALLVCTAALLCLSIAAFAYGGEIIRRVQGWAGNAEYTQSRDENGVESTTVMLHTEDLTDPVEIRDGRMIFVANGEETDITEMVSPRECHRYEYMDDANCTHYILVGPKDDNIANYGYAEYIRDENGSWLGGYSARINTEADGTSDVAWLETGKAELGIPW